MLERLAYQDSFTQLPYKTEEWCAKVGVACSSLLVRAAEAA